MSYVSPEQRRTTLWMGDVVSYMNEDLIQRAFASMDEPCVSVKIMKDKRTGFNLSYCFVDFGDTNQAKRVLLRLNGKTIPNTNPPIRFKLKPATYGKQDDGSPEFSLFVGDLTPEVDDYILYTAFEKYDSIKGAKVICDQGGVSRGFGFVRFGSETDQQLALVAMQGSRDCGGKPIRVSLATQNKWKPRQDYNSGGGGSGDYNTANYYKYGGGGTDGGYDYSSIYRAYQQYHQYYQWNQQQPTGPHGGSNQQQQQQQPGPSYYQQQAAAWASQQGWTPPTAEKGQPQASTATTQSAPQAAPADPNMELQEPNVTVDVEADNAAFMERAEEFYQAMDASRWCPVEKLESSSVVQVS